MHIDITESFMLEKYMVKIKKTIMRHLFNDLFNCTICL